MLVSYLQQLGVEYIFGVPGGAIEPLYNAMARSVRRGGLRPVVARHETGAVFMAQGYSRETGKLGVCCTTTGPGAINALTGVASAYYDEVPMLIITGQTSQDKFGRGALQDSSHNGISTLGIFEHCTCYNTMITDVAQFEAELTTALMIALDRSGPAHITLPVDLMRTSSQVTQSTYDIKTLLNKSVLTDINAIEELITELDNIKNIVIVVGEGCADSIKEVVAYAEIVDAILISTPGAKGLINPFHPQYNGVFGFAGHARARAVLYDPTVEFIMAVGSALGEWDTAGWDPKAMMNDRLIHIDSSLTHLTRSPMAHKHVRGDIKTIFKLLLKRSKQKQNIDMLKQDSLTLPVIKPVSDNKTGKSRLPLYLESTHSEFSDDSNGIKPQYLMMQLAQWLPRDASVVVDAGNSTAWAIHYLFLYGKSESNIGRAGWFRMSTQFASMGWAIGHAIGAAIGNRKVPIACITGDGSVLMNGQEFTVAVAEKLNIVFIILNDSAYGMVKHGQRLAGAEPIAFELPKVDFCSIAKAMGGRAMRLTTIVDLEKLDFEALCRQEGPTLLDVNIDPEEVPPMNTRIKVLGGDA